MQIDEFFTWETLGSYAGAALFVWLATNTIRTVTGWDARWLGLAVSAVVQVVVWWASGNATAEGLALAVLNTFVVYLASTGTAAITGKASPAVRAAGDGSFARAWW